MDGQSDYNNIRDKVYKILLRVTGIKKNQIDETTPWYELDTASFELVEFIITLREEFKVNLTTKQLIKMRNLKELIDYIQLKIHTPLE